MAKYISAEITKKALDDSALIPRYAENCKPITDRIIDSLPAADVEPVRHGRWKPVFGAEVFRGDPEAAAADEITGYECSICDVCLAPYLDADEAKKCEKSHCLPVEIENMRYKEQQKYPNVISVRMSDGKTLRYIISSDQML